MKGFAKWLFQLVVALISIWLISGVPLLIYGFQNGQFLWKEYIDSLIVTIDTLFPLQEFSVEYYVGWNAKQLPLFPNLAEYIEYSLQLLFIALAVAIFFALLGTFFTMMLKDGARQRVKMVFYFLESLPDILIILLVQLSIVIIYKQTGYLVSKIAVLGDERIYLVPVLCLMILPMIQLYRLSMLTFESEERQMYVELAKSLGFSKVVILFSHIFRNAVISVFFQSKKTMWFMLSNLFILELMFNIPGIMLFLSENMSGVVFLLTVLSFFLPVFLLYSFGEWFFVRRLKRGGGVI